MSDASRSRAPEAGDQSGHAGMSAIPRGLWQKCPKCRALLYNKELERNLRVCSHCSHHFRLGADERIAMLVDEDSFVEVDAGLRPCNPLDFPDYGAKLEQSHAKSGQHEAFRYGDAVVDGVPIVLGIADFGFMGGSMGAVHGEKVARALERAVELNRPIVIVCASGGARMQEGIVSLMQMAKTSAACARLTAAGQLYVAVFTDPTTAGVLASYASLADIIIAEPGALVGFAGPRVIEQNLKVKLPPGTHTAEFQLQHGMVDMVTHRRELRQTLSRLLTYLAPASAEDRAAAPAATA